METGGGITAGRRDAAEPVSICVRSGGAGTRVCIGCGVRDADCAGRKRLTCCSIRYGACNQILVLDDGKLVESGTHSELMEKKGLY